jgi:hypothetical protein
MGMAMLNLSQIYCVETRLIEHSGDGGCDFWVLFDFSMIIVPLWLLILRLTMKLKIRWGLILSFCLKLLPLQLLSLPSKFLQNERVIVVLSELLSGMLCYFLPLRPKPILLSFVMIVAVDEDLPSDHDWTIDVHICYIACYIAL